VLVTYTNCNESGSNMEEEKRAAFRLRIIVGPISNGNLDQASATLLIACEAATIETFKFQPQHLDYYDQEFAEQILDYPLSFSFVVPCFAADPVLVELY